VTIGIVGGSGDFGQGLAARFRILGEDFVIGSRTPRGEYLANDEASRRSEIIFLCVPPDGVYDMVSGLADAFAGRIVVSVAANVRQHEGPSLAEVTAGAAPEARVVAGFHTISAKLLNNPEVPLDEDVLLCGEDDEAKQRVGEIAERIVSGRAVDCGGLRTARRLESLTGLLIAVNKRYKTNAGVRVTGLS
jgi:8-hydroxy-5-deazaflavin:NADPH oxidoreductase